MFEAMSEQLSRFGVIPVVALSRAEDAEPLAEALLSGGIGCAEITFRTEAAEEAIRRISGSCPEMLVGAGTVLSLQQAQRAVAAGAKFLVAPGFDPELVDWCIAHEIPVYPGVMTPSEVTQGVKRGLKVLKFFPAGDAGGTAMLKALSGPFPGMRFIPTGGVGAGNLEQYLSLPQVAAVGGTWMVKKDLIAEGRFERITELAKEAMEKIGALRAHSA